MSDAPPARGAVSSLKQIVQVTLPLAGLLVLAAVLALVIFGVIPIQHGAAAGSRARRPYEYLYLDPARVRAYLGQLDGGDINQETRTSTFKDAAGGKIEVKALGEVSGSISGERTASAVVSFSEADNFFKLEQDLASEGSLQTVPLTGCCASAVRRRLAQKLNRLAAVDSGSSHAQLELKSGEELESESEGTLEQLPIGSLVKLEGAFLHVPPYLAAYPSLRYASFRVPPGRGELGAAQSSLLSETEVTTGKRVRRERKRFIADAGSNPRVPFTVELHGLTIVIPARFDYLTGDPSLLGTDVTVVGIVVFEGEHFGEAASEATYLPALLEARPSFLEDLGFNGRFLARYAGRHRRRALDRKLFEVLQRSLSFSGESVEIIPVAIYG
jgi:hypothetical protein